ncbi:MAG: ComEA family DNA-binding protein [Chromatocurvus sp.]
MKRSDLLSRYTPIVMSRGIFPRLSRVPIHRKILGSLLLAATLAMGLPAPQISAQEEPVAQAQAQPQQTVNINTAKAEALSSLLSGVGPARAEAIVRYREMYGPFESMEELLEVSGVGEATLARNRALITLE